jgi:hypothetical protein
LNFFEFHVFLENGSFAQAHRTNEPDGCQATLLRHCVLEESMPNAEMQEIQGN